MEIKQSEAIYCLNPRRIIYIEYFLVDERQLVSDDEGYAVTNDGYGRKYSPDIPQSELEEGEKKNHISLGRYIRINMTDNQKLTFKINNDSEYNEIKEKLERIIGG